MKKEMVIAFSCTSNWFSYLAIGIHSLLECTKSVKKIYILSESEDLNDIPHAKEMMKDYQVKIEMIPIVSTIDRYLEEKSPNRNSAFSNMCFSRVILPNVIKEDKVVYIDTDTLVRGDISSAWEIDISSYYLAAIEDVGIFRYTDLMGLGIKGKKYFNSGFLIMNLKKIRKEKIVEKCFDIINKQKLLFPDQDALNVVCGDKTMYISSIYNYAYNSTKTVSDLSSVKIYHYVGKKKNWVIGKKYDEYWFEAEKCFYDRYGWPKEKMLDIIIPLYNSKTIADTLASIAYQTDTNVSIYLVDDCSSEEYDYSKILDFYRSFLDIHYIRLGQNGGPGIARQVGLEQSNSSFIIFMDSDDSLGKVEAISTIKKEIEKDNDITVGVFVEETPRGGILFHRNDVTWLHGKIYKRAFLEKNHVHFNDTRKNEDNFFNQLVFLHQPKRENIDSTLYIYRNNMDSLTRMNNYAYKYEGSIYYAYNISEAMREAKEDHCDDFAISYLGYRCLAPLYYYYIEFYETNDVSRLIEYSKRIYKMINFDLIDEKLKEKAIVGYMKRMIDRNYKLLLKGVSFDDFMKMIGDVDD